MVQSNKILTVSYGTFSCTLEGFDESFETMKAIAEYFRDLAADDRYFGAEPPTPDAEMLARIAEREIARRVEAHTGDDGIVLRPSLAGAAPAPVAAEMPAATHDAEMVEEAAEDATDFAAAEAAELANSDALREALDDTLAASDEEEPDDREADTAAEPDVADADDHDLEDTPEADAPQVADIEGVLEEAALDLGEMAQSDGEDRAEDDAEDIAGTEADHSVEHGGDENDENSIAAKLRRIRNVVNAPAASESFAEDDYSEDQHVEDVTAEADSDADETADMVDDIMETLGSGAGEDVLDANDASEVAEADEDEAEAAEAEAPEEVAEAPKEEENAPEAVEPPKVSPRRPVRVVKVKRRSVEEAVSKGKLVEEQDAPAAEAEPEGSLSKAEEDDLQRELAEVAAELEQPQNDPEADEAAERAVRAVARRDQLESFGEDDSDVSRLMAETDEQLKEPEGKNRRNAIAHLRAAVAATRADRTEGRDTARPTDPRDAYRDDLAQAVRPRRGFADGARSETPRVAPLKLVAEQRVDIEDEAEQADMQRAAAQAVRPRRVSLRDETDADEEPGGFAAFAEERGATRLPDLLEAAASYMSFVEGRKKFSRPQLMNKVRQIEEVDSSREDRLRSFGQLLREGKIEKVEGGRFAASESIGFKPSSRAAG